jgi:hypothetical protein
MKIELRPIVYKDWKILLYWANDISTRKYSLDQHTISEKEHLRYIERVLNSDDINVYILEVDGIPVATIKDSSYKKFTELSYTVSSHHRGKRLSVLLMDVYLYGRSGNFLCRIKNQNAPSISMVNRCGFTLDKEVDGVGHYVLKRQPTI